MIHTQAGHVLLLFTEKQMKGCYTFRFTKYRNHGPALDLSTIIMLVASLCNFNRSSL